VTLNRSRNPPAAFTTTQLIAGIVVVTIATVLAWPTIKNAVIKREVTRTMNHAREFYLAGLHMATDGAAKSDSNLAWPGDYPAASLAEYCGKLVQNNYLKPTDLQRILSAPDSTCTVTTTPGSPATVILSGKSALKVYKAKNTDDSSALFAASANYVYNTPLSAGAVPFGDHGFVVIRKSGDADMYWKNQATLEGWGNNISEFRAKIGTLAGAPEGNVASGDGPMVLTPPQ